MSKALIFDCDGVLGDTEQFGHLPAFNQMWRETGRAVVVVGGGVRPEAEDRRRQGAHGEPVSGAGVSGCVARCPGRRRSAEGNDRRLAQAKIGHLQGDHPVGPHSAAPGGEAPVGGGAGRGLDAGCGFHLGEGVRGGGAAPRRGRGDGEPLLAGAGRRRGQGEEARAGHLPAGGGEARRRPRRVRGRSRIRTTGWRPPPRPA